MLCPKCNAIMDEVQYMIDGFDEYGLPCKVDVFECYLDGWTMTVEHIEEDSDTISLEEKRELDEFLSRL